MFYNHPNPPKNLMQFFAREKASKILFEYQTASLFPLPKYSWVLYTLKIIIITTEGINIKILACVTLGAKCICPITVGYISYRGTMHDKLCRAL